jgi:aminoglycoside phosphotransferase (APT) family kinase protein
MREGAMMSVRLNPKEVERRATVCIQERFPGSRFLGIEELKGGASSLTYLGALGGAPVNRAVIKVAPAGLEPVRNRDVLRQARLLSALHSVEGIVVPDVYGTDAGDPPESPPLFVMSHVDGDSFEPITGLDGPSPGPAAVKKRGLAAARMLAHLHAADFKIPMLADEPVFTHVEEVDRWANALATCAGDLHPPAVEEVERRLRAALPGRLHPAITHGDYRLGNMLSVGDKISAVIDWEIYSINDPRVDLGWFLGMSDPRRPDAIGGETGMPDPCRLAQEYLSAGGAPVSDLAWFVSLARFKQAAISALIVKHERRSDHPNERALTYALRIPPLLELALEDLDEGPVWLPSSNSAERDRSK